MAGEGKQSLFCVISIFYVYYTNATITNSKKKTYLELETHYDASRAHTPPLRLLLLFVKKKILGAQDTSASQALFIVEVVVVCIHLCHADEL